MEAPAPGSSPEALRRAALLTGWALRYEAEARYGVDGTDLVREACMRDHIAAALANGQRPAVVVGAFHTPALLSSAVPGADTALVSGASAAPGTSGAPADPTYAPADAPDAAAGVPGTWPDASSGAAAGTPYAPGDVSKAGTDAPDTPADVPATPAREPGAGSTEAACTVSLIPYTYPLLDSRSGYPAGIRDPEWQHTVLDAAGDPAALHEALIRTAVRVCVALREQGHPYGPADGREVVRVAGDLARLRDLPAPGRGEFLEAVQTVLGRGETYGTGRAVAHALERVLVGSRTGRPTPAAPRSGLGPAVEAETEALSLPGPADTAGKAPRDLRLDPARSALDGRRELLLRRLTVCGIPYAQEQEVTGAAGSEGLTTRWQVRWTPATAAMLTAAGARGVTPAQVAEGVLRGRHAAERAEGGPTAAQVVRGLTEAAECGLPALAEERLTELAAVLPASGTLPELLAGLDLLDRVAAGHLPGLAVPRDLSPSGTPDALAALPARLAHAAELLTSAAVRQVDGLTGSEEPEDARALLELAQRADRVGGIRLADALARLASDGTPLIAAAAGAVRVLTGHEQADTFGVRVASWVDAAVDSPSRAALIARLTGVLTAAGPLLTVGVAALDPLLHRVVELDDAAFLARLPALRGGFDTLSPAARDRLLDTVEERLGERVDLAGADDPAELARRAVADLAARDLLARLGLPVPSPGAPRGTRLRPTLQSPRRRPPPPPQPRPRPAPPSPRLPPTGRTPTPVQQRRAPRPAPAPPKLPAPRPAPTQPPGPPLRRPASGVPPPPRGPSRPPTGGGSSSAGVPTNCRPGPPAWPPRWTSCTGRGVVRAPVGVCPCPARAEAAGRRRSPASASGPRNSRRSSAPASVKKSSPPLPRPDGRTCSPNSTRPPPPPPWNCSAQSCVTPAGSPRRASRRSGRWSAAWSTN